MSIKCRGAGSLDAAWHVGETKNISVEGVTVEAPSLPVLDIGSSVELLCFPEEVRLPSYLLEPEPVRMTGRIRWQDKDKHLIGVDMSSDGQRPE